MIDHLYIRPRTEVPADAPVTICPPVFAAGAKHTQVREASRRRVRAAQKFWREAQAFIEAERLTLGR